MIFNKYINNNRAFFIGVMFFSFLLHKQLRTPFDGILLHLIMAVMALLLFANFKTIVKVLRNNSNVAASFVLVLWSGVSIFWSETFITSLYRVSYQFLLISVVAYLISTLTYATRETLLFRFFIFLVILNLFFIIFVPSLGRMDGGITGLHYHKNQLGGIFALISVIFFLQENSSNKEKMFSLLLCIACFLIGAKTAAITIVICIISALIVEKIVSKNVIFLLSWLKFLFFMMLIVAVFFINELIDLIIHGIPSEFMTGRGAIWGLSLSYLNTPYIGEGFSSFWQVDESVSLVALNATDASSMWLLKIMQAHNGYVDTLLSVGLIGLSLLLFLLLKTFINTLHALRQGKLVPFAVWVMTVLYNFSETSFLYYFSHTWVIFLIYTLPSYQNESSNV